jgi:hypothetical protein
MKSAAQTQFDAALFAEIRQRIKDAKTPLRMVVMAREAEVLLDEIERLRRELAGSEPKVLWGRG